MWFWLSLIAILFWSGSDLFSKMGSRPEDKYSHWKLVICVGAVMGIHGTVEICTGTPFSPADMLHYLPASLLYILSMTIGYAGLRYIELSISSPICNSSGAVAALLCFLFLGERLTGLQFAAVALVTIAVVSLAAMEKRRDDGPAAFPAASVRRQKYERSFLAILFPILYCILDGLGTFADAIILTSIPEESANIAYEYTFLVMGFFAFLYLVLIKKEPFLIRREKPKIVAALFETAGQFAYIFAIGANAITAAPMISAYCIVSLLWSRIFLKERLSKGQYGMIALAAVGIVILGAE